MSQASPMKKGRSEFARPLSIFQIAHHSDIIDDNGINDSPYLTPCNASRKAVVHLYTDQGRSHGQPSLH